LPYPGRYKGGEKARKQEGRQGGEKIYDRSPYILSNQLDKS
jgi:hypothetical protein